MLYACEIAKKVLPFHQKRITFTYHVHAILSLIGTSTSTSSAHTAVWPRRLITCTIAATLQNSIQTRRVHNRVFFWAEIRVVPALRALFSWIKRRPQWARCQGPKEHAHTLPGEPLRKIHDLGVWDYEAATPALTRHDPCSCKMNDVFSVRSYFLVEKI